LSEVHADYQVEESSLVPWIEAVDHEQFEWNGRIWAAMLDWRLKQAGRCKLPEVAIPRRVVWRIPLRVGIVGLSCNMVP
jgi:hypothetical protein